jgi:hypothetical protein
LRKHALKLNRQRRNPTVRLIPAISQFSFAGASGFNENRFKMIDHPVLNDAAQHQRASAQEPNGVRRIPALAFQAEVKQSVSR